MAETIKINELADARGWTHQKVRRRLDQAGVKVSNGTCNAKQASEALAARGNVATSDEKRFLECELLKIDIDKARGALAEVDVVVDSITRRDAELAGRIRTWRETLAAKHPEHIALFQQAFDDLNALLAEPLDLKK